MDTTQILGIIGNVILVASYLPQIKKIIVTKQAEDLSILMWFFIVLGDACLMVYSILTNDSIFTALFTLFTVENGILLFLTYKYGKFQLPFLKAKAKKTESPSTSNEEKNTHQ